MVIKTEMYPGGGYKQMGYSIEEEKIYTENYYDSNNGSSMQMVRPNPCISTPQPPHSHLVAGAGKYHDGHQHGHSNYFNKENMHGYKEKHHHEGSLGKEKYHSNAQGQNYYGDGRMLQQETIMFSGERLVNGGHGGYGSETHYASHTVMAPNKHETMEYSGGSPDRRRVHYFELKNLDD